MGTLIWHALASASCFCSWHSAIELGTLQATDIHRQTNKMEGKAVLNALVHDYLLNNISEKFAKQFKKSAGKEIADLPEDAPSIPEMVALYQKKRKANGPMEESPDEDSSDEDEEMKEAPKPVVNGKAAKKEESSDDDSSDEEEEEAPKAVPIVNGKATAKKEESSDDDSSDDEEEEAAKPKTVAAAKKEESSDDDSSDDEEEEKPKAAPKAVAVKKEESSDDDSSEDEEEVKKPEVKA